jgi:hypothetical protein
VTLALIFSTAPVRPVEPPAFFAAGFAAVPPFFAAVVPPQRATTRLGLLAMVLLSFCP